MKIVHCLLRSRIVGLSPRFQQIQAVRTLSTSPLRDFNAYGNPNSSESTDDLSRIFSDNTDSGPNNASFFQKFDRFGKAHDRSGLGSNLGNGNIGSSTTLSDGTDRKLAEAALSYRGDADEVHKDGFRPGPDVASRFTSGLVDKRNLDLRFPSVQRPQQRKEFEVTTEEVLRKADFRNVRFLANFVTEAGVIIKRSKTKISAKAQRKVAREIKTARAFGLLPFTSMGSKHFVFGKTMENRDEDYEYQIYDHNFVDDDES